MFYKQREDFLKSCAGRDEQFPPLHEVIREADIPYAGDTLPAHRLDIYYPKEAKDMKADSLLPVMINIHGGGLLIGNKEFNRPFCERIARKGFLVFSLEYQLIPDCMIFDQFQDVFLAFDYIKEHLGRYHGDPERIYASADSGGACLLTYVSAMQNSQKLADAAPLRVRQLIAVFGGGVTEVCGVSAVEDDDDAVLCDGFGHSDRCESQQRQGHQQQADPFLHGMYLPS